jgi:hypothetical protein
MTKKESAGPATTDQVAKNNPKKPGVDQDIHKGATEEDRPGPDRPSHPGLDKNGMPNDAVAIAQDKLGAEADKSQG